MFRGFGAPRLIFAVFLLAFSTALSADGLALGCSPGAKECVTAASARVCLETAIWGAAFDCLAGQQCSNGECMDPIGCNPGTTECLSTTTFRTCGNYAIWGPETSCPYSYLCANGQCYNPQPPECNPGAMRCSPSDLDVLQVCSPSGRWTTSQICDNGCRNGFCRDCRPGYTRCSDTYSYQQCGNDGNWGSANRCSGDYICSNGACIISPSLQCSSPGSARCSPTSGNVLQMCGGNYRWADSTYCQQGCSSGACRVCSYGDRRCYDLYTYQSCGSGGQWAGATSCPTGYACSSGMCNVKDGAQCTTKGAKRCSPSDPSMLQICNSNYVFADYQPCGYGCINGACAECKPGTSSCAGASSYRLCQGDGTQTDVKGCPAGSNCDNGQCVLAPVCTDGDRGCRSGNVNLCKGGQWALYLACPSDTACTEAQGTAICPAAAPTPAPPAPTPEKSGALLGGAGLVALAAIVIVVGAILYFFVFNKRE